MKRIYRQQYLRVTLCIVLMLCLLPLPASAGPGTLYVILVADTDSNIGMGVKVDLNNMRDEVNAVIANTGLTKEIMVFAGSEATIDNVVAAVENLWVGSNDVILFYYSGHGKASDRSGTKWPDLTFDGAALSFGWVVNTLKSKGARFVLGLADSCNNYDLDSYGARGPKGGFEFSLKRANYEKLFLESKGFVFATSSQPGEISCLNSNYGSRFTNDFRQQLYAQLGADMPKWDGLQSYALPCTYDLIGQDTQTPYYEISLLTKGSGDFRLNAATPSGEIKPTFCIQNAIDVKLENNTGEAVYGFIVNQDTSGNVIVLYQGWVDTGIHMLSGLVGQIYTVGGPAGTEYLWFEDSNGRMVGDKISFEVQNCSQQVNTQKIQPGSRRRR